MAAQLSLEASRKVSWHGASSSTGGVSFSAGSPALDLLILFKASATTLAGAAEGTDSSERAGLCAAQREWGQR